MNPGLDPTLFPPDLREFAVQFDIILKEIGVMKNEQGWIGSHNIGEPNEQQTGR
jgi:hypothetical protein